MWYPHTVTVAPASEPVSAAEAKAQCRIDGTAEDTWLATTIAAETAYIEKLCGICIVSRTLTAKCDSFADFANLPILPLGAVSSVSYVDAGGTTQTLSSSVYEVRSDNLTASIVLKSGQSWPSIQTGSRITVTATAGFASVPPDLKLAVLLLVADRYDNRGNTVLGSNQPAEMPHAVTALLTNYRTF